MLNKREISKYKKAYQEKGYVLVKNFIDKKSCKTALNWLNKKNKKKLAKSWTEQEPGVDLAVLFVVHNLKNNPLVKIRDRTNVYDMKVREVHEGEERKRLWDLAVSAYPPYKDYQEKTNRIIPVFIAELSEGEQ